MNLKDAFRAQNKLQSLMDEASDILQDRGNTLKVTTTHLRSKVMPEAQDAVVEESAPSEYAEHINQEAAFLMDMLAEREKLSAAICAAKLKLPLDMDSETGLNRARQSLAGTFRRMAVLRKYVLVPFSIRKTKTRPYASPLWNLVPGLRPPDRSTTSRQVQAGRRSSER